MVDKNYSLHERVQHRNVAANKPGNCHRDNHSVQHERPPLLHLVLKGVAGQRPCQSDPQVGVSSKALDYK